MGVGLGRGSPVQLSLSRENYEALIERHGQWIRWRTAAKCACVNPNTFQPDIHCRRCDGRGVVYSFQPFQVIQTIVMAKDNDDVLEIDSAFCEDELLKVYDNAGKEYVTGKNGNYIVMKDGNFVKSSYYNILLKRKSLKELKEAKLRSQNGYYVIPAIEQTRANIDGIYYSAPGDIIGVDSIIDSTGEVFEAEEFRLNKILLKPKFVTKKGFGDNLEEITETVAIDPIEPLVAKGVKYVPPFVFALLSQNLSKGDAQAMVDSQGDAICTFPYSCDVAESDVLTVLAGTITQKEVQAKTGSGIDPLPAFFVSEIVSVAAYDGTEFKEGEDYVLYGTNSIKWLTDYLDVGDGYSITFKTYPTYTVIKNIPQLRSSENQRFPKKAIVKYMSSYSEKRKVNRQ